MKTKKTKPSPGIPFKSGEEETQKLVGQEKTCTAFLRPSAQRYRRIQCSASLIIEAAFQEQEGTRSSNAKSPAEAGLT
ncbi:hypothetical protein, partial [Desulfovibrio sp. SGI.133]|uniref:hypothetical protein n=1 Tax=Desulfovibrio sp. SGI.133 TaxID=3420560 RepID=UPI003CFCF16E